MYVFSCMLKFCQSDKAYHEMEDWVLDVRWTSCGRYLAIIHAHNRASLYDWSAGCAVQVVHCEEVCIMYAVDHLYIQLYYIVPLLEINVCLRMDI